MSAAILESGARAAGDIAGVFLYDGETGYFYLYEVGAGAGSRIVGSIHVLTGQPDFTESDVAVRWDRDEENVGLFIRDVLWAVFDAGRRLKYGGNYRAGSRPALPPEKMNGFGANDQAGLER